MKLEDYRGFDATAPPETLGWDQLRKVAELLGIDLKGKNRKEREAAIRQKRNL